MIFGFLISIPLLLTYLAVVPAFLSAYINFEAVSYTHLGGEHEHHGGGGGHGGGHHGGGHHRASAFSLSALKQALHGAFWGHGRDPMAELLAAVSESILEEDAALEDVRNCVARRVRVNSDAQTPTATPATAPRADPAGGTRACGG